MSPEEQEKKVREAFDTFQKEIAVLRAEHDAKVKRVLREVDDMRIQELKKQLYAERN